MDVHATNKPKYGKPAAWANTGLTLQPSPGHHKLMGSCFVTDRASNIIQYPVLPS